MQGSNEGSSRATQHHGGPPFPRKAPCRRCGLRKKKADGLPSPTLLHHRRTLTGARWEPPRLPLPYHYPTTTRTSRGSSRGCLSSDRTPPDILEGGNDPPVIQTVGVPPGSARPATSRQKTVERVMPPLRAHRPPVVVVDAMKIGAIGAAAPLKPGPAAASSACERRKLIGVSGSREWRH